MHQQRGTARQLADSHNLIDTRNLADAHSLANCPDLVAKFYDALCPGVPDEVHTADERQAYSDALGDYRSYRAQEARFARRATSPVAARRFYREYTADWVSYWALRHQMADAAIRVVGVPKVKWSRPALIRLTGDGGGTVHLRLCLDARDVKVTKRGEPVPQNTTPTVSRISMSRLPEDVRWKFLMAEAGAPC